VRRTRHVQGLASHLRSTLTSVESRAGFLHRRDHSPEVLLGQGVASDLEGDEKFPRGFGSETFLASCSRQCAPSLCQERTDLKHVQPRGFGVLGGDGCRVLCAVGRGTDCISKSNSSSRFTQPLRPSAALFVRSRRLPWSELLERVFGVDALRCKSGRPMRVLAAITDPAIASRILACMDLATRAPPLAPARNPDPAADPWPEDPTAADFDQTPADDWGPSPDPGTRAASQEDPSIARRFPHAQLRPRSSPRVFVAR
jgi:hypothetical protein